MKVLDDIFLLWPLWNNWRLLTKNAIAIKVGGFGGCEWLWIILLDHLSPPHLHSIFLCWPAAAPPQLKISAYPLRITHFDEDAVVSCTIFSIVGPNLSGSNSIFYKYALTCDLSVVPSHSSCIKRIPYAEAGKSLGRSTVCLCSQSWFRFWHRQADTAFQRLSIFFNFWWRRVLCRSQPRSRLKINSFESVSSRLPISKTPPPSHEWRSMAFHHAPGFWDLLVANGITLSLNRRTLQEFDRRNSLENQKNEPFRGTSF